MKKVSIISRGKAVIVGNVFISGGKTAGGNGGEGMVNASQKPMPHSIKAAVAAAVKQKYTQKRASAVSLMRGRGLEEVGPVLSAFTIFVVPRPACGKRATKMTMMPRPPSQWVMARKKRMDGGRARKVIDDGGPGAGEAGHAFHQSVQRGEGAGTDIGNGIEQGHGNPGKGGDGGALPGVRLTLGDRFLLRRRR